jgi:hypothetical protein
MSESTIRHYRGIILKQNGPVTGDPPRGDPDQITYDYMVTDPDIILRETGVKPTRRISVGAKVVVAQQYDPCEIVIVNNKRFLYVHEGIAFRQACT